MTTAVDATPLASTANARRLRAVLLGCGTVNTGVLDGLGLLGEAIEVSAIVTRRKRPGADPAIARLTQVQDAFDTGPDVVIEAMPDCPAAEKALALAAERGIHIISANKAILARRPDLETQAAIRGASVRYSASVGGGVPVLETIAQLREAGEEIVRVRGVLNGTSNYVLDQLEAGTDFKRAIQDAQTAGFAEADPSADIDGFDAAAKLALIARKAFDEPLDPANIPTDRLALLQADQVATARAYKFRYRQCAEVRRTRDGVAAEVRLKALPETDPLSRARREENCIEIQCSSGLSLQLHGKGAGQEPTARAMLGDLRALLAVERAQ